MKGNNYTFDLNTDVKRRDEILFGAYDEDEYRSGGTRSFEDMTLEQAEALIKEGFLDPRMHFNNCPDAETFVTFAKGRPEKFVFEGCAVSVNRGDYRIDIDGIHLADGEPYLSKETRALAAREFSNADELDISEGWFRAWWD